MSLKGVNKDILTQFQEVTTDILKEMSPEEALQRAFAYMCG
jgi:hypothetical protein